MDPLSAISATSALGLANRLNTANYQAVANKDVDPRIQADKAAREFEAVFLSTIINKMLSSVPTDGPFGGGQGEEMFRSFLGDEYAKSLAGVGGIGLAPVVSAELLALQEVPKS